jgi:hypothetical protein
MKFFGLPLVDALFVLLHKLDGCFTAVAVKQVLALLDFRPFL